MATRQLPDSPAQVDDFACTGPPPFAGHVPDGETNAEQAVNRHVEAVAFAIWRAANCPLEDSVADDGCTGPPVFAGTPADPADPTAGVVPSPRADEAAAHADARSGCQDTTTTAVLAASATPGVPESLPAGPPDSIPAGPPASTPAGPPDGVPAARPRARRSARPRVFRQAHPSARRPARPRAPLSAHPPDCPERLETLATDDLTSTTHIGVTLVRRSHPARWPRRTPTMTVRDLVLASPRVQV